MCHYFNLILFFQNNGSIATLCSGENLDVDEKKEVKKYSLKSGIKKYFVISIYTPLLVSALYQVKNNTLLKNAFYENFLSQVSSKISVQEIQDNIFYTSDTHLSQETREYLINSDLINDVVVISDTSRSYILKEKTKNINIFYFMFVFLFIFL